MRTKTKTSNDLAALKGMTPKQLRERYTELYGEPSRSGNKQWLIRRCAWRIQALTDEQVVHYGELLQTARAQLDQAKTQLPDGGSAFDTALDMVEAILTRVIALEAAPAPGNVTPAPVVPDPATPNPRTTEDTPDDTR